MDNFRAYRINEEDGNIVAAFQEMSVDDLTEGNVVVRVSHSTINYKDALAATGKGRILRRYPLNGGIDLAGVVVSSEDTEFQPGTEVLVNGCGLSETVDGGYAEYARVDSKSLVAIPEGMTGFEAMQIGTAGYTAALAIHRMEQSCYGRYRRRWQYRNRHVGRSWLRGGCTDGQNDRGGLPESDWCEQHPVA
jgi:NADPH2:quinone reductase